jgi:hypothetical protein
MEKNINTMKCKFCESEDLIFKKLIGLDHDGKTPIFQYWAYCNNCHKSFSPKRNRQIFDIVKDQEWKLSKRFNNLKKQKALF